MEEEKDATSGSQSSLGKRRESARAAQLVTCTRGDFFDRSRTLRLNTFNSIAATSRRLLPALSPDPVLLRGSPRASEAPLPGPAQLSSSLEVERLWLSGHRALSTSDAKDVSFSISKLNAWPSFAKLNKRRADFHAHMQEDYARTLFAPAPSCSMFGPFIHEAARDALPMSSRSREAMVRKRSAKHEAGPLPISRVSRQKVVNVG